MTVTVTKRGITKAEKHFKGSCCGWMGCGTEIECLGSDLQKYEACRQDPRETNYEYVKCPVCSHQITNLKEFTPKAQINDPRESGYNGERR